MPSKSFIEVLEEQIRTDLRREVEAEVRAEMEAKAKSSTGPGSRRSAFKAESLETWLATHVSRSSFAKRAAYAKPSPAETTKASAPVENARPDSTEDVTTRVQTARATSAEELCALELLVRNSGAKLRPEFTEAELKSVWRRAALKTHPDRFCGEERIIQVQKAALFRELASAYDTLRRLFDNHDVAA